MIKNIDKRLNKADEVLKELSTEIDLNVNKFEGKEVISKNENDRLSNLIHKVLSERPFASFENIVSTDEIDKYSFGEMDSFYSYMEQRAYFEKRLDCLVKFWRDVDVNYFG